MVSFIKRSLTLISLSLFIASFSLNPVSASTQEEELSYRGAYPSDSYPLKGRIRLLSPRRPAWVNNIPRRSLSRWIDYDKGIYLSNRGSIIGPHEFIQELPRRVRWNLPTDSEVLSRIPESYKRKVLSGEKLESHHLIEARVASLFDFNKLDLPAVSIPFSQHRGRGIGIHSDIQRRLRRASAGSSTAELYRGQLARIQQTYQNIYSRRGHDDWLDAISAVMEYWHSR